MNGSKRSDQKEETRKKLIKTALGQFVKDGILTAKTADIAAAAGVAHGTLFVHFSTRESLLTEVILEFGQKISSRIHELEAGAATMHDILEAHINGLIEYESFYTKLVVEGPLLPAEARHEMVMIQSAISYHLSRTAQREIEAGRIRNIPLHLLFNTWIGLIHYYLVNRELFTSGGSVLARHKDELLEHFINLISL